jgi:hypothetical protein
MGACRRHGYALAVIRPVGDAIHYASQPAPRAQSFEPDICSVLSAPFVLVDAEMS